MLQPTRLQRVEHDLVTEQQYTKQLIPNKTESSQRVFLGSAPFSFLIQFFQNNPENQSFVFIAHFTEVKDNHSAETTLTKVTHTLDVAGFSECPWALLSVALFLNSKLLIMLSKTIKLLCSGTRFSSSFPSRFFLPFH